MPGPTRALLLALALLLARADAAGAPVRVLLAEGLARTTIEFAGGHEVRTTRGARATSRGLSWPFALEEGRLVSGDLVVGDWVQLAPDDGVVRFDGQRYRGALRIEAAPDGLRVINVVDLEAYLRGVVPAEMRASWPMEALKAQAVAARSYVLASLDPTRPWDVCASEACQVYRGTAVEHPRSDRAVRATEGIVITYDGAPAAAYYHADSGGTVASAAEVWGRDVPYLRSRNDAHATSPHRGWTARLDPARLARALVSEGYAVGTPTALSIEARTASGRAARAAIEGTAGRVVLEGPPLTRVLRGAGLKSTRVSVVGPLTVRGDGWGHGVGMSQHGARALALAGHEYGSILAYYYPGIGLQRRIYRAEN